MKVMLFALCCLSSAALAQEGRPLDANQASPKQAEPVQQKPESAAQTESQSRDRKTNTRADRLDLDTTVVTGNRELPKVLYIVPWKKAEIGDLPAQPFNTLLDEVLSPVDREVFKREVKYFHTVTRSDAPAAPIAGETKDSASTPR